MKFIPHIFIIWIVCSLGLTLNAQEPHVIKVKKEQNLEKVYFDNTELKLIPIDRFGNPRDNRIVTYKFWIKGKDKNFQGSANKLAPEMVQALNKLKKATKIYFTEIQVEDENGHLIKLPDVYETWFPDCKNCGKPGGKK